MAVIVRFAALYTAIVFVFGFILGTLRVLLLIPVTGELAAVVIEIPIMLVFAFLVAGKIFAGRGLTPEQGVEIGLCSFLLLQAVESLLAGFIGPQSYLDNILIYLGDLVPPRLVGLVGQILFAIIPFIHILRSRSDEH
jgi:hypothetical protein